MKRITIPAALALVFISGSPAFAQTPAPAPGSWNLLDASLPDQDRHHRDRGEPVVLFPRGTARIFLGWKALDEHDWDPVESQGEFAILTDFGPEEWPVRLAADLRFGAEEERFLGVDATSFSWELNLGVRQVFDTKSPVRPYFGGGVSIGGATLDLDSDSDSDSGMGLWIDFGVDIDLGGPVSLGLELCFSLIPIDIAGEATNAGGVHFGITVGFSW
jgi:hypothetical protein